MSEKEKTLLFNAYKKLNVNLPEILISVCARCSINTCLTDRLNKCNAFRIIYKIAEISASTTMNYEIIKYGRNLENAVKNLRAEKEKERVSSSEQKEAKKTQNELLLKSRIPSTEEISNAKAILKRPLPTDPEKISLVIEAKETLKACLLHKEYAEMILGLLSAGVEIPDKAKFTTLLAKMKADKENLNLCISKMKLGTQ